LGTIFGSLPLEIIAVNVENKLALLFENSDNIEMRAGFDIGATTARFVVVDSNSAIVHKASAQSRGWSTDDALAFVSTQLQAYDADEIGVAIAAQLSQDRERIISAPNLGWKNVPFRRLLSDEIGRRVHLHNDVEAATYAEMKLGAARGFKNILSVFVGTGVGGAFTVNGRLIRGSSGVAGEIGHVLVSQDPGARMCGCGRRGCLEAYVGGKHLEKMVEEILPALVRRSRVVDVARADEMVSENPRIEIIWQRATDFLAMTVANACTLLNPDLLLLGGGVLHNTTHFKEDSVKKMMTWISSRANNMELRFSQLGDLSGALGAAIIKET